MRWFHVTPPPGVLFDNTPDDDRCVILDVTNTKVLVAHPGAKTPGACVLGHVPQGTNDVGPIMLALRHIRAQALMNDLTRAADPEDRRQALLDLRELVGEACSQCFPW